MTLDWGTLCFLSSTIAVALYVLFLSCSGLLKLYCIVCYYLADQATESIWLSTLLHGLCRCNVLSTTIVSIHPNGVVQLTALSACPNGQGRCHSITNYTEIVRIQITRQIWVSIQCRENEDTILKLRNVLSLDADPQHHCNVAVQQ